VLLLVLFLFRGITVCDCVIDVVDVGDVVVVVVVAAVAAAAVAVAVAVAVAAVAAATRVSTAAGAVPLSKQKTLKIVHVLLFLRSIS